MTKKLQKTKPDTSFLSNLDIITLIYCGWIMLYLALGWNRAVNPAFHFPVYLSIFTGVILLAWLHHYLKAQGYQKGSKILHFVRSIYTVNLFGYFFISGYVFNRIIFANWQDPFFMKIDELIFGYYPSLEWANMLPQRWINEIFAFAYFSYYPMIVGLPLYLYFKDRKAFNETIFSLTMVFYICYFIYSWLPVIGGRYFPEAMELSTQPKGYLFSWIMAYIYRTSTHLGGAFPSSHVAIALVLSLSALRHKRWLGSVFLTITFFLTLATVYLHYHWFIDAIAGVFMGFLGIGFALWTYKKLQRNIDA
jgi:membrane-associated phospholipid phosphatase